MVETPYSIGRDAASAHQFDLKDLGDRHYVHVATLGSYKGGTQTFGYHNDVTIEDYDRQFRDKLRKLDPPQRVREFLDHHLAYFEETGSAVAVFLDHVRYNVLHQLEQHFAASPNTAVARDWFNTNMENNRKQHQITKAKFLSRAFELALEKDPAKPTRVQVTLEEMASLMDIDAATARRIRDELAQDGLVKRIGNYPMFLIEPEGRRAVERMHTEGGSTLPTIVNQYNASGGSILQVATGSPHATQTANVGDVIQEARTFTDQLSAALPEIQKVARPTSSPRSPMSWSSSRRSWIPQPPTSPWSRPSRTN